MSDFFSDIIGLTIEEALPKVKARGINRIRATSVDGTIQMGTADYREDRLSVSIADDKITAVGRVG